jgi:exosortase K
VGAWLPDAVFLAAVAGAAFLVKGGYSRASPSELRWILGPTTWIVERITGAAFDFEPGAGYLDQARTCLVAPACAGVNFLLAAFLTGCLGFLRLCRSARARIALFLGALAAAYAATVLTNALRIAAALHLHGAAHGEARLLGVDLSGPEGHRMLGVAVYLVSLSGLYLAAQALLERALAPRSGRR